MTVRYLVDTDWTIHYVNGHPGIVARLDALKRDGLGLSLVSLAELYEGVYYSTDPARNERGLTDLLRAVTLIGVDVDTCRLFGRERGRLRQQRKPIADFDLLIGVTALQHDLTLLTNNRRHFELVGGLRIESQ